MISLQRFENAGKELGELVDKKQQAYGNSIEKAGKLLHIFLSDYDTGEGGYLIPYELVEHLTLMVRIIDKQNRIFNNPKGDLMEESPYKDLSGYGLLGNELMRRKK